MENGTQAVNLEVSPSSGLTDEELSVRVTGLSPGERVVVWASTAANDGERWESRASFEAGRDGVVDVFAQAPLTGTYTELDAGGLLWSMLPPSGTPGLVKFRAPWDALEVAFVAKPGDRESAHATVERRIAAPGVTCTELRDCGLVATLFRAAGEGPHPALVLYHGSSGGIRGLEPAGALLASHGYTSLVLGYYGVPGRQKRLRGVPLESLAAGVHWLRAQVGVVPGSVGAVGVSVGAEGALAMASWLPDLDLRVVVAVSPSGVVWQAHGEARHPVQSRWCLAGRALPFVPMRAERLLPQALRRGLFQALGHPGVPLRTLPAYEAGLGARRAAQAAAIPVERIAAPLLLIAGEDDQVWPSEVMALEMLERREASSRAAQDHVVVYPDSGHLTLHVPGIPTTGRVGANGAIGLGGTASGDAQATADAWRQILSFLGEHLDRPASEAARPELSPAAQEKRDRGGARGRATLP